MIYEKIDSLIADAIKTLANAGNPIKAHSIKTSLEVFRAIKTEFATLGYNATHIPTKGQEINLLKEMIAKRRKAADIYEKAGEKQRAADEMSEVDIIANYLPESDKPVNPEDVKNETMCVIRTFVQLKSMTDQGFNIKQLPRYTKDIITKVKEKYPNAENTIIAGCIQEYTKS